MIKEIHYEILKVGSEPHNRFLQKTMVGTNWTHKHYSHKFLDLGEAVEEQRKHENSCIIWVDKSKNATQFYGSWGEVNRDYIARTF
tara:strand:+ start:2912 stop:3169 length:258 start_codon:yes stop_codon:yes gene_type:complete